MKLVAFPVVLAMSCGALCGCVETPARSVAPRVVPPAMVTPSSVPGNAALPAPPPKQNASLVLEEPQPSTRVSSVPEELAKRGYLSIEEALRPDGICGNTAPSSQKETLSAACENLRRSDENAVRYRDLKRSWGFSDEARLLEAKTLGAAERAMVLWLEGAFVSLQSSAGYACPAVTTGSHYLARAHVSLVNTKTAKVINTIDLRPSDIVSETPWDGYSTLPFSLPDRGNYEDELLPFHYRATGGTPERPALVEVLSLEDYNGDGKAHEFALFEQQACMGLQTALIGYSERQDRLIQYRVILNGKAQQWTDYLFAEPPISKRHWRYQIDYRGRGGTLDSYDIRYDRASERFVGTVRSKSDGEASGYFASTE